MVRLFFCFFLSATTLSFAEFQVRHDRSNGHLEIHDEGRLIATYSYLDGKVKRPYFSNIKAPNGVQVTRHWPPREGIDAMDHDTMHPGIWMGFGRINDADFWRNKSLIRHDGFLKEPEISAGELTFTVKNSFEHEGRILCVEEVTHTIVRKPHGYLFNFDSRFLAIERLYFGDHQEMGVGIRMATPLRVEEGNGRILNSEGHRNEAQGWGRRADWCDYSGSIDGKQTGAMLMPDPRNIRPSRFHSRDYGFTAANPFGQKDFDQGEEFVMSVKSGKRLHLQFGVLVYSLPSSDTLDHKTVYQDYVNRFSHANEPTGQPWKRHTIDDGSRGADGVRLGDLNQDGLPDVTTGWEQGGEVRIYLNPGPDGVRKPWPKATVGEVMSTEDAVFVDLNGDGRLDVVSSTEGKVRTVYAHFAPTGRQADVINEPWSTKPFPVTQDASHWMFAMPMQIDGKNGQDLVLGSKAAQGYIGWLQAPEAGNRVEDWQWHKLLDVGWIMSLRSIDIDEDGLLDIVYSDRVEPDAGVWWLKNPGANHVSDPWQKHYVTGKDSEVMFLDVGDLNADGLDDFVAATLDGDILVAYRENAKSLTWREDRVPFPIKAGTGKAVAIGDMDQDKVPDLVVTCEHSEAASGVFWLKQDSDHNWHPLDISGDKEGVKFDRIELLDLDADGDLDVLTCEERHNLGVIWYENPVF